MSVVLYVVGLTASGKSSVARELAFSLGLPLVSADQAYSLLQKKLGVQGHPGRLTDYQFWDNPENFGIKTWGAYESIWEAKQDCFSEILHGLTCSSFIIEGFTLAFSREREIVRNIVGAHESVILELKPSFDDWCDLFYKKFNESVAQRKFEYVRLSGCLQKSVAEKVFTFSHPEQISINHIYSILPKEILFNLEMSPLGRNRRVEDMFITFEEFEEAALHTMDIVPDSKNRKYWNDYKQRWIYHSRAIEIMRKIGVSSPDQVLELGTMGCSIVKGSHVMDYDQNIEHLGARPKVLHDARSIPWPIRSDSYEWFVSLRVFHHLWPVQRECFEESRRVAKNVLLVVPPVLPNTNHLGLASGITPQMLRSWNNDASAEILEPVGQLSMHNPNFIYLWRK